jgi:integrase
MHQSKRKSRKDKPAKPYPDFPLFPHATKRWGKKIKGRLHYFGPWDDPDGALQKYLDQKDDLFAGRKPRKTGEGYTVRDLCNHFLNSKRHLLDTRELKQRTFDDYKAVCERIVRRFGRERLVEDLRPEDFEALRAKIAKTWGPVTVANFIQRARVVFKYASDNDHIVRPVRYGQGFKRPSQKTMRRARNAAGLRMFEAAEIREMLGGALVVGKEGPELVQAGVQLRGMILLGINCGYGNSDVGNLPLSALDLERGWVTFPRPKTEIVRRCPLWPETIEALREAIARRPVPKSADLAGLVFITKYGESWAKETVDNRSGWKAKSTGSLPPSSNTALPAIPTTPKHRSKNDSTSPRKRWTNWSRMVASQSSRLAAEATEKPFTDGAIARDTFGPPAAVSAAWPLAASTNLKKMVSRKLLSTC